MNFSTEKLQDQMTKLSLLNDHPTYRITKLSKLLETEATLRLKGTGINLTAYRIMLVISIFEEITVSDLSRLMVIDRAQVSRLSSELTKQGYLTSKADKTNKLKKLLMLTAEGQEKYRELSRVFKDRKAVVNAHGTEEELNAMWKVVDRVCHDLADRIERAS